MYHHATIYKQVNIKKPASLTITGEQKRSKKYKKIKKKKKVNYNSKHQIDIDNETRWFALQQQREHP